MAAPDLIASTLYVETNAPSRAARRAVLQDIFATGMMSVELFSDIVACTVGWVAASAFTSFATASSPSFGVLRSAAPLGVALGLIVVTLSYCDGGYRKSSGLLQICETERAIRFPVQAFLLLLSLKLLLGFSVSWLQSFAALFTVSALLILEKRLVSALATKVNRRLSLRRRTVIYGAGELGRCAVSTLLRSPRVDFNPIAVVDSDSSDNADHILELGYRGRASIPVVNRPLTTSLLKSYRCQMLLLADSDLSADELASAIEAARHAGSDIAVLRNPEFSDRPSGEFIDVDGILFSTSRERPELWRYLVAKRLVDIVASSLLFVLLAPLLALIAILVSFDSPGPALFVQRRVGRNGEIFQIFKFRSMFIDAPRYARSPTTSSDPRITRIGRVLRRFSLDELPQLLNVLLGTMSLVGPRPEMPFVVESYDARQRLRLKAKPGITGLWQLSADRSFPIHQNTEYDLYYIRNRTLSMDAAIMIHTLIFALCGGI